ncbi:MAG: histidine kinase [Nitrosopumilus sp.]|nr:histidine kinase [Nitrosopumilus sp.]
MKTPEIVPDKISNPINPRVIFAILSLGIVIFVAMNLVSEGDAGVIASVIAVSLAAAVAFFSFIVSRQNETGILAKSYFSLGLGFTSYVIAELLYYSMEMIFGIEPYPSIADLFFFAVYPFTLIHLILNIRFFHSGFSNFQKIAVFIIPIIALAVYVALSISIPDAELGFDFYYGLIFVVAASVTLSFSIVGAVIFKEGALGAVWLLLVIALMINAAGDVWYYHLEIFGEYFDAHPVTVVWYVANLFIVYALIKHLKII